MMSTRHKGGLRLAALVLGLCAAGVSLAQTGGRPGTEPLDPDAATVVQVAVDRSRGVDRSVDYAALTQFGPWDDRNYALTARDLAFLSPNERDATDPIPAFYRVEMRKANPKLPTEGQAQYPRSALNGYLAKYGGYQVDGVVHTRIRANDGTFQIMRSAGTATDASGVLPNFVGGETRITTPAGAAESAIAIHPTNSNLVIAGTNGPGSGQKMWYSSNGGVSWSGPVSLANTCCDPAVGWSPDGTVAYASALSTVVGSGTNILFYRSTNNGQTWTLAKQLNNGNVSDKEYFTVDHGASSPYRGRIHLAWHDGNVQKFAMSSDGGLNWTPIQTLDSASRGIGSDLTTDPAGNVYFFFPTTSGGSNAKQIRMLKSTNGGTSFGAASTVSTTNADFDFPIPSMETRRAFIYVSADHDRSGGAFNGRIYASWTDTSTLENNTTASANHAVVRVAYSSDGGATWTLRTPHPTADVNTVDRYNQWLSVDSSGRVFVMYYDTRHSSGRTGTDVYYSVSTDGGNTWSAGTRLTTVTSRNVTDSFEWGDYNGMDAMMSNVIAIYTDNRDESGGTAQSVDVYGVGFQSGTPANNPPTANFSFTTSGLTATFTDSSSDSDGTIASRSWNFGDGGTSTATNPSRTYAAAGTYNVQLTVTDNGGATNTITKAVTVSSGTNAAPTANFTFTTSGLTATFTDSSTDSDGTIASRSWNFGDGGTSTATNPSRTYAAAGTYNVQLTVTDNGGATNSRTQSVTVTAPPGNALQNGVPLTGQSGALNAQTFYTVAIPAGASNLNIVTSGGTGDADLYVRFGSAPTLTTYDCRPFRSGNAETCTFAAPSAGTYHVMLNGYSAYSGLTIQASWSTGGGGTQTYTNTADVTIPDNNATGASSTIAVSGRTGNGQASTPVAVNIVHPYIGDLIVDVIAPDGTVYNVHNRTGGSADNINTTFNVNLSGEALNGSWRLRAADRAAADTGYINSWSLTF
jgi:PKD repeat protein